MCDILEKYLSGVHSPVFLLLVVTETMGSGEADLIPLVYSGSMLVVGLTECM